MSYDKSLYQSPTYYSWCHMKQRCLNPNDAKYPIYGGRGIKVCKKWLKFENFYKDMGSEPRGLTLDRIDNSKDYSPENCRWTTPKQQANNRRTNRKIEYNGVVKGMAEWADDLGVKRTTMYMRYHSCKWTIEKCLETPIGSKG